MFLRDEPFISPPPRPMWKDRLGGNKVKFFFGKVTRKKVSSQEVVCIYGPVESVAAVMMDAG